MFKKVFDALSRTLSGREWSKFVPRSHPHRHGALLDRLNTPAPPANPAADAKSTQAPSARAAAPSKAPPPAPARDRALVPMAPSVATTPEEMCGITARMTKDEIKARLALLYRRYNRATSSLDATLRAEAEAMLDAIVTVREKVFGPI